MSCGLASGNCLRFALLTTKKHPSSCPRHLSTDGIISTYYYGHQCYSYQSNTIDAFCVVQTSPGCNHHVFCTLTLILEALSSLASMTCLPSYNSYKLWLLTVASFLICGDFSAKLQQIALRLH